MALMKYPVAREFIPHALKPSLMRSRRVAAWFGSRARPPQWIWSEPSVRVERELIAGFRKEPIEILTFEPRNHAGPLPALVYCHGGGFIYGAVEYHYRLAVEYARQTPCKVIFVQYRLAPANPFPAGPEDCYAALRWTVKNAGPLNLIPGRVAVGGDSSGGALAAALAHMARDSGLTPLRFQLLIYPVTDRRMRTRSQQEFRDTPVWDSRLNRMMWDSYLPFGRADNIAYASPAEAGDFRGLPPAYIETAEFDCLRDEGIEYAGLLREAGVPAELNETRRTMHGFDAVTGSPITQDCIRRRIAFMRKNF